MDQKKFPAVEPAPKIDLDEVSIAEKVLAERTRVFHNRSITGALLSPLAILLVGWIQVNVAGLNGADMAILLLNFDATTLSSADFIL